MLCRETDPIVDFWFPWKPRGKATSQFVSMPRKGALPHVTRAGKHYLQKDMIPMPRPSRTKAFEVQITQEAIKQARRNWQLYSCYNGAVHAVMVACFSENKSDTKKIKEAKIRGLIPHTMKPDKDNVDKLLFDAIKDWIIKDDTHVVSEENLKIYGPREGMRLILYPADLEQMNTFVAGLGWPEEEFKLEG